MYCLQTRLTLDTSIRPIQRVGIAVSSPCSGWVSLAEVWGLPGAASAVVAEAGCPCSTGTLH